MKFLEGYKIYIEFEKIDRKMRNNPLNIKYKRASVEMNCTPKVRFFCLTLGASTVLAFYLQYIIINYFET